MEMPSASVFRSLLDVKESDIIPVCAMSQSSSADQRLLDQCHKHKVISEIEAANQIAAYLDVDFKEIEVDALKLRLKDKMSQSGDSSGSRVHNALVWTDCGV